MSDETLVYFDPAASNQFDPESDAEKLFNDHPGCPEIYSIAEPGHSLCINTLAETPVSVPLGISFSELDSLVLTAFEFEGIPSETGIFLEDKELNTWLNLREQAEYLFFHDPSQAESRFALHLTNVTSQEEPVQDGSFTLWSSGKRIYISNPDCTLGEISLYSLDGRCLESFKTEGENQVIEILRPAGIYVARVTSRRYTSATKIFIY